MNLPIFKAVYHTFTIYLQKRAIYMLIGKKNVAIAENRNLLSVEMELTCLYKMYSFHEEIPEEHMDKRNVEKFFYHKVYDNS